MRYTETALGGAFLVELEPRSDERGMFARTFCAEEFAAHGLEPVAAQCNLSRNRALGTLRGLHYQVAPHGEAKLVRCTRGALWDVIVDLRAGSPSRGRFVAVELDAASGRALYVPRGCAHGFQTLVDDTEVFYQMSTPYRPEAARGVRFDDPALAIPWPIEAPLVSERDRALPGLAASLGDGSVVG